VPPIIGDKFADFTLPDHSGQSWQLSRVLDKRALVLVFYRGDW
jgi:peroxiredoxin